MSRLALVSDVIGEFGNEIGMPNLMLDDEDRVSLLFDEIPVSFDFASEPLELLWIYVDLGELPDGDEALEWLLQLGFVCWAENRMTIGVNEDGGRAVGHTVIPATLLDLELLKQVLQNLLAGAGPIRERLASRDFTIEVPDQQGDEGTPQPAGFA